MLDLLFLTDKMILLVLNDLDMDIPFSQESPLSDPSKASYDHVIMNMQEFLDI